MVRNYEPRDLEGCAAVFCSAFRAAPWNEQWTQSLAETRISELTGTALSAAFVYEDSGGIRGFAAGRVVTYLYGREYVIDEFCVAADAQGQGLGTELLSYIADTMHADGVAAICLQTTRGYPSEKFYLKNGFHTAPNMLTMYRSLRTEQE